MQHSLPVLLACYKFSILQSTPNYVVMYYVLYILPYIYFIQFEIPTWDLKFCLISEDCYFHDAC